MGEKQHGYNLEVCRQPVPGQQTMCGRDDKSASDQRAGANVFAAIVLG
jgi:hypothetical protein